MTTIENEKYKLEIEQDENPESPREFSEHITKMVCFHSRYKLGDENTEYNKNDYNSWDELKAAIIKKEKPAVILPIYAYEHSGITISTTPFGCRWDSGQVGFIFMSGEEARDNYSVKRITAKLRERITKNLLAEIEEVDQYLAGDVYNFTLTDVKNDEEIHSCSGFYGDNFWVNGMWDNIDTDVVESLLPELIKEYGEKPI